MPLDSVLVTWVEIRRLYRSKTFAGPRCRLSLTSPIVCRAPMKMSSLPALSLAPWMRQVGEHRPSLPRAPQRAGPELDPHAEKHQPREQMRGGAPTSTVRSQFVQRRAPGSAHRWLSCRPW
jgi:hypothetical protein